jgi:predicted porin
MHHRKKMLVAAVAATFGGTLTDTALADSDGVEIYGRLYPEFTVAKTSGATPTGSSVSSLSPAATGLDEKGRNSVDTSNSRLGFRGKEDLGSGLNAIWQIESKVSFDVGTGNFATRNSFGGLEGGFGTVRLGNMDTVYKSLGNPLHFLGIESGNFVSIAGIISSTAWGNKNVFHVRQPNSLLYDSPKFGGVQVSAQYSPDETRTGNLNAYLMSYGVKYENGPLYLAAAHEVHNDMFGFSSTGPAAVANVDATGTKFHSKDTATRLTAMYAFGQTRLSVDASPLKYQETGGAANHFDNYKNTTWDMAWEQTWGGPWKTAVQYGSASAGTCGLAGGAACDTSGLEAKVLNVGGLYSFSKRSGIFALYSRLTNGSSAAFNNTANIKTIADGSDITQYAIGIVQNF